MSELLLSMQGITKRFPGVVANDSVDLTVYKGELHALLGENGAGKSTLMNILSGIYFPNEGRIFYAGQEVKLRSPMDAVRLGIGMVHQHYKLVDTLSVAENIYLYANACPFLLDKKKMENDIGEFSRKYNLPVEPSAKVRDLSVGEQQRVEILKLLYSGAELLILDEPTAVLTPQESEALFSALKKMAADGKTVLFISHKLDEIMSAADRITVLRAGKTAGTMLKADCTADEITSLMIGRAPAAGDIPQSSRPSARGACVLRADRLCVNNNLGLRAVNEVSFSVFAGEIFGIAGISGNGQVELAEALAGIRKIRSGTLTFKDKPCKNYSARAAIANGLAYIPDDRLGVGLVGPLGITQNAVLKQIKSPRFSSHGIIHRKAAEAYAKELVTAYNIQNAGLGKPVSLMSGGNMQKLLLAREISDSPALIIAACPTRGLDIDATETIHRFLLEEKARGAAIILISEDLNELFGLAERIAVLCDGSIMDIVSSRTATPQEIGSLMTGLRREAAE